MQKLAESFFAKEAARNREEKARKRISGQPKVRWTLVKFGKWFIHFNDDRTESGGVQAQHRAQRRSGQMIECRKEQK